MIKWIDYQSNISKRLNIKGLDNQVQVSKYVCLIIKSLDTQVQGLGPESPTFFEVPSRLSWQMECFLFTMTWSRVLLSLLGGTKLTNTIHKKVLNPEKSWILEKIGENRDWTCTTREVVEWITHYTWNLVLNIGPGIVSRTKRDCTCTARVVVQWIHYKTVRHVNYIYYNR